MGDLSPLRISRQRAVSLCKKHAHCAIPADDGSQVLMPAGVKLTQIRKKFYVFGYAHDDSDIIKFSKKTNTPLATYLTLRQRQC